MKSTNGNTFQWRSGAIGFAVACSLFIAYDLVAADTPAKLVNAEVAFKEKLPNVPGKEITGVLVTYAPGGKSSSHAHAGSVYAYVISGRVRSENSVTGPVKVYSAGQGFFEPPGSVHTISENASDTEPARLLAIFVADGGAQLTKASAEAAK
jgi:quercetin dioxygenase-like cupin family protein